MIKLFEVRIDNDPGGWKSGEDNHVLVLADSEGEAISKVENGYSKKYDYDEHLYTYGVFEGEKEYISQRARLSATEIIFQGVELTTIRVEKLKRINKKT
jgi:hypothetical protein